MIEKEPFSFKYQNGSKKAPLDIEEIKYQNFKESLTRDPRKFLEIYHKFTLLNPTLARALAEARRLLANDQKVLTQADQIVGNKICDEVHRGQGCGCRNCQINAKEALRWYAGSRGVRGVVRERLKANRFRWDKP